MSDEVKAPTSTTAAAVRPSPPTSQPAVSAPSVMSATYTQRIMSQQQALFSEQLQELHRLIHIQKVKTGRDPLNGKPMLVTDPAFQQAAQYKKAQQSRQVQQQQSSATSFAPQNGVGGQAQSAQVAKKPAAAAPPSKLAPFVDDSGGISSPDHVLKMLQLVAKQKEATEQLQFLKVLCLTKKPSLKRFIEVEGLKLLNSWLTLGKKEDNVPFLKQIIKVLEMLPVTLKDLRAYPVGKNINRLKNHPDKELSENVNKVMEKWMNLLSSAADLKLQLDEKKALKKLEAEKKALEEKKRLQAEVEAKKSAQEKAATDDFDSMLSEATKPTPKPKLAPDHLRNAKRHKLQLLSSEDDKKKPVTKTATAVTKALSSDDIRKAKLKEKILNGTQDEEAQEPPTKKIRTAAYTPGMNLKSKEDRLSPFEPMETEQPKEPEPQISPLTKKGLPKKKVHWPAAAQLELIKTFDTEPRFNPDVNFDQARLKEHIKERESIRSKKKEEEQEWVKKKEMLEPSIKWRSPPAIDLPDSHNFVRGEESKQKVIESSRQESILTVFYFNPQDIPDTPSEPDMPTPEYDDSQTRIIPFEERVEPPKAPEPTPANLSLDPNLLSNLSALLAQHQPLFNPVATQTGSSTQGFVAPPMGNVGYGYSTQGMGLGISGMQEGGAPQGFAYQQPPPQSAPYGYQPGFNANPYPYQPQPATYQDNRGVYGQQDQRFQGTTDFRNAPQQRMSSDMNSQMSAQMGMRQGPYVPQQQSNAIPQQQNYWMNKPAAPSNRGSRGGRYG